VEPVIDQTSKTGTNDKLNKDSKVSESKQPKRTTTSQSTDTTQSTQRSEPAQAKESQQPKPQPKQPKQPKQKTIKKSQALAHALQMARNLRPDREASFDAMERKLRLIKPSPSENKKRKQISEDSAGDDLFSADAIAAAIKKQRTSTRTAVINPTDGSIIKVCPSTGKVVTQPGKNKRIQADRFSGKKGSKVVHVSDNSDSDSDSGDVNDNEQEQLHQFLLQDHAEKDFYEDADDMDADGNELVSLSKDVVNVFGVRNHLDDLIDKHTAKQAHDQYERKKKVVVKLDEKGRKIHAEEPGRLDRTLFLSNIPTATKQTDLKHFFEGVSIETMRFRSAGFESQHLPHWVQFAKKSFHEKRDTMCAYVVLKSSDDIQKALAKNQHELLGKHIRVDLAASEGKADPIRSIFIGNLPFDISEETLYQLYAPLGDLEAVRCVRDPKTGMGKGFAIVTFLAKTAVPAALQTNGTKPASIGRPLRVVRVAQNAFEKTASFRADQMRLKMKYDAERAKKLTRSEKMKQDLLNKDGGADQANTKTKSVKVQGAFQKLFGNASVGHSKKPRHDPRSSHSAPSWMGTRAKPSDTIGRNKVTKKAGKDQGRKSKTGPKRK
jgi:nucleolar protein 12